MNKYIDSYENIVLNEMKKDISHNLEVAKPRFLYFIKNMNVEISQWIHYDGVEIEGSNIIFKFKSSQNSLNFKINGGINTENIFFTLKSSTNEIFNYFKNLKHDNI